MPHVVVQLPQWAWLVMRSTHDPLHIVRPDAHMHAPVVQTPPSPQLVAHAPQFVTSRIVSTQTRLQSVSPALQRHEPALQVDIA